MGPGRPGGAAGLDGRDRRVLLGPRQPAPGAVLLRHHRDQLPLSRLLRRRAAGRPVFTLVPGALLRPAALQREPGGISASAQVLALSLDGDLAGVQPRHGALDLADRTGHVSLAAAARRAGGGAHRRGHLRRERLRLGPSDPHQHDQCSGQRPVRDLGTGSVVGVGSMARGGARRSGPGVSGLRRPPSGRAC